MKTVSKVIESSDYHNHILSALSSINDEFEEHLLAINENTQEIQESFSFNFELDNKITKLNERIDEIFSVLSKMTGKKLSKVSAFEDIDPLTKMEKSVFLNIYAEDKPVTYAELARKMNLPILVAREHVQSLMEKGIPVRKTFKNTRPYLVLDKKFRNLQAKKNILKIEQKILL